MTFSRTVMPQKGRGIWKARPIPRRQRSSGRRPVMSCPSRRTVPADGETEPASTLSSVVFPAPFGPTTPTASDKPTEKSTWLSTCRSP